MNTLKTMSLAAAVAAIGFTAAAQGSSAPAFVVAHSE